MLVLIDESGDASFNIARGATPYLAISMVIFRDFDEAENVSSAIHELRNQLKLRKEFKFSNCKNEYKELFFNKIRNYDFTIRAIVSEKNRITSPHLRNNPQKYYNYLLKNLLEHDGKILQNASIKLDGSGSKAFRIALQTYLRQQIGSGKIVKLKFANSETDNLIQLADMVVGALARSYKEGNPFENNKWRTMLHKRIDNVWDFL